MGMNFILLKTYDSKEEAEEVAEKLNSMNESADYYEVVETTASKWTVVWNVWY